MKDKRLIIAGIAFTVLCLGVIKTGVIQMVYSNMQDTVSETMTIQFSIDPNSDARASVSPDVRQLAFCTGSKEFFVQDLQTREITTYPTQEKIFQVKYSPDGTYVAAGINVLNVKTGKMLLLNTDAVIFYYPWRDYLVFSANGKNLALVNHDDRPPGVVGRPTTIEIWNLQTEKLVQKLPVQEVLNPIYRLGTDIREMAFSPDGRYLAVAAETITIWDVETGKLIKSLVTKSSTDDNTTTYTTEYKSLAYSPDGKYLAAAFLYKYWKQGLDPGDNQQQAIEIWNMDKDEVVKRLDAATYKRDYAKGETIKTPSEAASGHVKVKYSPDGRYIAVGSNLGRANLKVGDAVWIWDASSGQLSRKLQGFPDHSTQAMEYSADGKYLSASGSWHAKIWKLE